MLGDLFLSVDDVEPLQHRERVAALLQRGYDVVASVHTATGRLTQADKCSAAPLSDAALASASADAKRVLALRSGAIVATIAAPQGASMAAGGKQTAPSPPCHLRQLTRLHFVAADAVQASQLSSSEDVVRSYDLLSINPKTERALNQACSSLDVDLISLDLGQRLALKLRAPAINAALRRGIYFEICYAPGLREPTARRNLFCNAQALVRATRGKNILLSSSARSSFEVRSPLELSHMATLFGLTQRQAQAAISLAPRAVLARAAARRAGRGLSAVQPAGLPGAPATAAPAGASGPGTAAAAGAVGDTEMEDAALEEAGEELPQPKAPTAPARRAPPQQQQHEQHRHLSLEASAQAGGAAGGRKRPAAVR